MIILAIETSCDETAIAVLKTNKNKFEILSNVVASQIKIHAPWGGVVPNLAKREHQANLPIVLKKALKKANLLNLKSQISNLKIDLIAVTVGPGLEPCLWTGINFAETLSKKWNKPLIGINHMEGHMFSALLKQAPNSKFQIPKINFPALALLVSGGHTELVLIKDWLKYKIIGATRDDAAGEAFDKVAKMLNLGYPGGPEISKLASKPSFDVEIGLPRPMINSKDYDFSFSGLKTAVLYLIKDLGKAKSYKLKANICKEFQQAVIDVLVKKTIKAAQEFKIRTIILGGGVAANQELRKQLSCQLSAVSRKLNFLLPAKNFTTDNAAMIALAASVRHRVAGRHSVAHKLHADGALAL